MTNPARSTLTLVARLAKIADFLQRDVDDDDARTVRDAADALRQTPPNELADLLEKWAKEGVESDCNCITSFKLRHQDDTVCDVGKRLREAAAALRARPGESAVTPPSIDGIVQSVAELPDRTSPDDWPEAMLVTEKELREILKVHFVAADPAPRVQTWQPIESAPRNGTTVLVFYVNDLGNSRRVRAAYFEVGTLDMDDSVVDDRADEDGKNVLAGWFEDSDSHEPCYMPLLDDPTHWMPLPAPPARSGGLMSKSWLDKEFDAMVAQGGWDQDQVPPARPWTYAKSPQIGAIDACQIKGSDGFVGVAYAEATAKFIIEAVNAFDLNASRPDAPAQE